MKFSRYALINFVGTLSLYYKTLYEGKVLRTGYTNQAAEEGLPEDLYKLSPVYIPHRMSHRVYVYCDKQKYRFHVTPRTFQRTPHSWGSDQNMQLWMLIKEVRHNPAGQYHHQEKTVRRIVIPADIANCSNPSPFVLALLTCRHRVKKKPSTLSTFCSATFYRHGTMTGKRLMASDLFILKYVVVFCSK